jgi:iron complex outermembrane recepter protein
MCYRILFSFFLLSNFLIVGAQNANHQPNEDSLSVQQLSEVIVKGYNLDYKLLEVPAAINYISKSQFNRFSDINILPAINSTPGVRMEERSPGSYRMNVRGSTLRSPFGVRNVKVYWDEIPFTDPGGNTYLNLLSFFNIHSVEIIKGPAGSLYGSGTGGALLMNSQPERWSEGMAIQYLQGSFNLNSFNTQLKLGKDERRNAFNYTHQYSDGYRSHTNMRRDVASWQTQIKASDQQQISASILYGDLYYQTPGALNKAEYEVDHRAARPKAGMFPSAEIAKAAIYQKTFLAGITNVYQLNDRLNNTSVLYGAFSQIKNPTFRNYERRVEPHFGGRTVFKWNQQIKNTSLQVLLGGEGQRGFLNTKTFKNVNGNPDALLTDDEINNWIYTVFAQGNFVLPRNWNITAGASINQSSIEITRLSLPSAAPMKRTYSSEWAPRLAVSKKLTSGLMVYGSVSKGFSPPTVQEVLPSTSVISTGLEAEHGVSYEVGLKSNWLQQKLYIEVNAFDFRLKNTIVQRRDSSGGDYFINAGVTRQRGVESQIHYQILQHAISFLTDAKLWVSHTWNHFQYDRFKQLDNDFSKKQLPSVAPHTVVAGLDIVTKPGLYTNLTYFYSDPIALNDANTAYASSYNLLGGRVGWRSKVVKKLSLDLYAGFDNLFNVKYSLGNDINAAGGRYYNAAPGINYFVGIRVLAAK